MNMDYWLRIILAYLFLTHLTACDPVGHLNEVVQNDSSYDLWFVMDYESTVDSLSEQDSFLILNKSDTTILETNELGGIHQWSGCHNRLWPMLRLRVKDADSLRVDLDLNDPASWEYTILNEDRFGGGRCECRLVVTEAMIVK